MKKLMLLPLLALFAFASCSDEEYIEPTFYPSTTSLYFDARNPEPQKVTFTADQYINDWNIDHIYDQTDLVDNPEWCKATVVDNKTIEVTLLSNDSESNSRRGYVSVSYSWKHGSSTKIIYIYQSYFQYTQEELVEIVNKMMTDVEVNIPYEIGNNSSTYQTESNKFRIENGMFKYDGGVYESDFYGTLINEPFEIEVALSKKSHETFYPYNLSEYITMTGDDGKDVKITGTFYLSDYVYQYTGTPANFEAGSFSISVSGSINKSFNYYIRN
ncbi:MAG: hypothetical protein LUE26_07020 [Alistipes sp.]|nr:hypothetical protein [Alistipes sp.]